MSEPNEQTQARDRAARGAEWLLKLLESDGSLQGAKALDAYYKSPAALCFSGHPAEAHRVLDYVAGRFLQANGDLDGTGVGWYDRFRIYPHAWLTWGAVELGRTDLAAKLAAFLQTRHNAETGGFLADDEGTEEIMTTSMAGLACLRAGHMETARGAARWLKDTFAMQPDLTRGLLHVRKPGIGLTEGDSSVWYLVNANELRQWYFQYGISAAFLAAYAKASGDTSALSLAQAYLHASAHCREDRYRTPQAGKIGWGAAWTNSLTHVPEDRALVTAVVDGLGALQCGDGSWNSAGVYEENPADAAVARLDVTAEFVALLSLMGEEKARV
ncbi:MAG: hypothetical protein JST93_08920 [Acidobacteria bacterium]|nr:hypothetical protein [Acidobacteriota bacterium]